MSDDLRNKLASIALACSDYTTTDALDKITASLDRKAKRSAAQPPAAMPVPPSAWIDDVMEQAQVFASAWSLVGGRFDFGNGLTDAEEAKSELRAMLAAVPTPQAQSVPATGAQPDPMDWPLPCDVTVGHGTMRKGVRLGTLVARMKVLYHMATGRNADDVAGLTIQQREAMGAAFLTELGASPTPPQPVEPAPAKEPQR